SSTPPADPHSFPTRRSSDLAGTLKSGVYLLRQDESWSDVVATLERGRGVEQRFTVREGLRLVEIAQLAQAQLRIPRDSELGLGRSEEHTSELQSRRDLVCRL